MSNNDLRQIQELTTAIQELERTLANSNIAGALNDIVGAIEQMNGLASAPANEMRILHGVVMDFTSFSSVALSVLALKTQLIALGGPQIAAAAAIIGGISLAINLLGRAFGNNQPPVSEFTQSLNDSREAHQNLRNELERGQSVTAATARALLDLATARLAEAKENRWKQTLQRWTSYCSMSSFFNALNSSSLIVPSSKKALSLAS